MFFAEIVDRLPIVRNALDRREARREFLRRAAQITG